MTGAGTKVGAIVPRAASGSESTDLGRRNGVGSGAAVSGAFFDADAWVSRGSSQASLEYGSLLRGRAWLFLS